MYVCNCNGVTKREVAEAIGAGARCPASVLAHHGGEPCCGRCLPEIAADIEKLGKESDDSVSDDGGLVAAE